MSKYIIEWCADTGERNTMPSGKEVIESKKELKDRIDELKIDFGEDLEYSWHKAKRVIKKVFE